MIKFRSLVRLWRYIMVGKPVETDEEFQQGLGDITKNMFAEFDEIWRENAEWHRQHPEVAASRPVIKYP